MTERRQGGANGARRQRLNVHKAVELVRADLPSLLGRPIESVLAVEPGDDDEWRVTVQVVELERIPRSTDVLGAYVVRLDGGGELVGYARTRRYARSQADAD